jgi:hypothetical protein
MRLMLMPRETSWWIWLATATLLAAGLAGAEIAFVGAILLSAAQTGSHLRQHHSLRPYPVQIRVAYTALLILCYLPIMRWLYWLPCVGTFALVLVGYCLLARVLSLMPWNRTEPITPALLWRTFFTPPIAGSAAHGLPATGCPGAICESEACIGARSSG